MCYDMYACFKNPFYPAGRRLKFYYIALAGFLTIMISRGALWLQTPETYWKQFELPFIMEFKGDDFNSTNLQTLIEHPVGLYALHEGRCVYAEQQGDDATKQVKAADKHEFDGTEA